MKQDVAADPADIRLLGPGAEMAQEPVRVALTSTSRTHCEDRAAKNLAGNQAEASEGTKNRRIRPDKVA